jgi:hypothetical protein
MATADSRRKPQPDEMRPHYDISSLRGAVRGKYAARYAAGPHVVRLAPDVAAAFKSDRDVNSALRRYLQEASGRPNPPMTADQLLERLLDDRVESVVATIDRAGQPLSLAQIRRRHPHVAQHTIRLLLERCESEGRLRRVQLRGIDRWSPAT